MAAFIKNNFLCSRGWIYYENKFVARLRVNSGAANWISFMIKNFSTEEYFSQLDAGVSPLQIMESKGYMLPHIKKILKNAGYPVNKFGFDQYIKAKSKFIMSTVNPIVAA